LQVSFSLFLAAAFQFGPLEWLWRSLTYGTRMPFSALQCGNGITSIHDQITAECRFNMGTR